MTAPLRVYPAPDATPAPPAATVHVSLGELLPLIAMAHENNYIWLQDFLDDEVCISQDLYEVIRAFRTYRPTA